MLRPSHSSRFYQPHIFSWLSFKFLIKLQVVMEIRYEAGRNKLPSTRNALFIVL
jgi:hypothetical protein